VYAWRESIDQETILTLGEARGDFKGPTGNVSRATYTRPTNPLQLKIDLPRSPQNRDNSFFRAEAGDWQACQRSRINKEDLVQETLYKQVKEREEPVETARALDLKTLGRQIRAAILADAQLGSRSYVENYTAGRGGE